MSNRWSESDTARLRLLWNTAQKDELLQAFPERIWEKILVKGRLLGLPDRSRERAILVDETFFSTWNPDMAYVLGFWFADGWMTQPGHDAYICFVSKDREHLELIRDAMQSEHRIHPQGTGCFRLHIGSQQLWQSLSHLGGIPAKSLVVELPFIAKEYRRYFMRGYVDGDGTVRWDTSPRRHPLLSMVGGETFLSQVAVLLDKEAGVGIARVKVYGSKTPEIVYTGMKAKTLAKWLYSNAPLALERKAKIAQEFATWEPSKFGWKSQSIMTPKMQAILGGEVA